MSPPSLFLDSCRHHLLPITLEWASLVTLSSLTDDKLKLLTRTLPCCHRGCRRVRRRIIAGDTHPGVLPTEQLVDQRARASSFF